MSNKIRSISTEKLLQLINTYIYYFFCGGKAAPLPVYKNVNYEITYRCNLKCKFCFWWNESSRRENLTKISSRSELTFDEIKNLILPQFQSVGLKYVNLTGGEPLVRKDIFEVIRLFTHSGMQVSMISNLANISEKQAEALVNSGLKCLKVSVDGPPDIHDQTRGVKGTYTQVINTIENIQKYKKATDVNTPSIILNGVICKETMSCFSHLLDIANEFELNGVSLQFLEWQTEHSIDQMKRIEGFDSNEVYSSALHVNNGIEPSLILKELKNARQKSTRFNVPLVIVPLSIPQSINTREIDLWFKDSTFNFVKKCSFPFRSFFINPYGDVRPCIEVTMGNLKENQLYEIWNSQKYNKFRKKLKEKGIFQRCAKCCQIRPWDRYLRSVW
ncbi:MAG: radical SAM protein [Candidatus Hodarchaeota archaeon]